MLFHGFLLRNKFAVQCIQMAVHISHVYILLLSDLEDYVIIISVCVCGTYCVRSLR